MRLMVISTAENHGTPGSGLISYMGQVTLRPLNEVGSDLVLTFTDPDKFNQYAALGHVFELTKID